jgi:hypothetical protein
MEAPIISEHILNDLSNKVESTFGFGLADVDIWNKIKLGVTTMELALGIDDHDTIRARIMRDRQKKLMDTAIKNNQAIVHKRVIALRFFAITFAVLTVADLFFSIEYASNSKANVQILNIMLGAIFVFFAVTIILLIVTAIVRKVASKDKRTKAEYEAMLADYDQWSVLSDCTQYNYFIFDTDYEYICEKLGVDPEDLKVDFEKMKGGGSTWIGWGGIGAIGVGIGLSAVSKLHAARKNAKANDRLKELEDFCYYNNVAACFNSKNITVEGKEDVVEKALTTLTE